MQAQALQANKAPSERSLLFLGASACIAAGVFALVAAMGEWLVPLGIGAGVATLAIATRYPMLHWWIFFLLMPYYFRAGEEGFSVVDAVMAVYFVSVLVGWLVWTVVVRRKKILWEWKDVVLLLAIVGTLANAAVAVTTGRATLFAWAREWALLAMMGYYFVFRTEFASKQMLRYYVYLLVVVALGISVWGIVMFREQVLQALFAYQLKGIKGVNAPYLAGLLLAMSLYLHGKKWLPRIGWLLCSAIIGAGIVATYTRTIWLAGAFMLLAMVLLLPWKQQVRMLVLVGVSTAFIVGVAQFSVGEFLPIVGKTITKRALSAQRGIRDPALTERRDETGRLLRYLRQPDIALAGYGMGAKYVYYDTFLGKPVRVHFVHNGALSLIFKLGIPLGLLLYSLHLTMVVKGLRCYWRSRRTEYEPYVLPLALTLVTVTIIDATTNAFLLRSGAIFLAMLYAGIAIADRLLQQGAALQS